MRKLSVATSALFLCALTLSFKNITAGNPKPQKAETKGISFQGAQAVTFTENKGQVHDQNFKPRPDVLFGGTANGLVYHLRQTGISYQLERIDTWRKDPIDRGEKFRKLSAFRLAKDGLIPDRTTIYRVDINWVGANPSSQILTEGAFAGHANYYLVSCPQGVQNVKTYTGVTYKEIYKGIDLHYYEKEGNLKYDFLVSPNADYRQISFQVGGAKKIEMQKDGSLIIKTPLGEISEGQPLVYQAGKQLDASWIIEKNILKLNIEDYSPGLPLVIDPITRIWGTYYGGVGIDYVLGTTCDPSGNVYGVGATGTSGGTTIATASSYQNSYQGGSTDAFLAKFNTSGSRVWATYFGGTDQDQGVEIACDYSGNIYFSGITSSTVGIVTVTTTVFQNTYGGGNNDAFLAKFSNSGSMQWSTYYGDVGNDQGTACTVDGTGNVFLGGMTSSTSSVMVSTSGFQTTNGGGNYDAFVAKFNSAGVRQWGTFYGGGGDEFEVSLAADPSYNVYLGGATGSLLTPSIIATSAGHQTVSAGGFDSFLVKFDPTGSRLWGTYYGGSGNENGGYVCTDGVGNVFLTSGTNSSGGGIASTVCYQNTFGGGNTDAFVVKFNSSGVRQWGTYYGGSGDESLNINTCATDPSGNVYLGGSTDSPSSISTASSAYQSSLSGSDGDAYLVQFDGTGSLLYGTYYGGLGGENTKDCTSDPSGNIFMCGVTFTTTNNPSGSTTGIASSGAFKTSFTGDYDGFLIKFTDCNAINTPTNTTPTANRTICSTKSATLSAASSASVNWYSTATTTNVLSAGNNYVSSALSTGVYTFYAGSVSNCTTSASRVAITVTVLTSPNISANSGTICAGKSFTITATGASTYNYPGPSGSQVVSPSVTTTYYTTGTAANGCTNTGFGGISVVTVYNLPVVSVNSGYLCTGSSYTMAPSGASTYTYSSGTPVVSPTVNTNYSVTGTSSQGCVGTTTAVASITVVPLPTVSVNSGVICQGETFSINATGANTYSYSGGTPLVSPLTNTSYAVTGTSQYGCSSTNTAVANLTVNPTPTIVFSGASSICAGNSTTLTLSGASTYTWNSSTQSNSMVITTPISNTASTVSNTVIATSAAGCTNTAALDVTVNPNPLIVVNSGSICAGKSFTILVGGASTYTYSSGSNVVTPTVSGAYSFSVTGTSALGCASSNTAISGVTMVPLPTVSIAGPTAICNGSSASFTAQGGTTYTWTSISNATVVAVSPTANTTYTLLGRTAGCTSSTTLNLTVMPLPTLTISGPSALCNGNSITISANGASSYSWNTTSTSQSITISPTSNTSYTAIGTGTNGCKNSAARTITVNPLPSLTVTGSSGICPGASAQLQVTGAATYSWSNGINSGAILVSPTVTTTYTATGISSANCVSTITKTVTVYPLPPITATASSNAICIGGQVTVGGVGGVTYSWIPVPGPTNNAPFTPTVTRTYTVTGADASGCKNTATISVTVNPLPVITATSNAYRICAGESATIIVTGASTYTWNNGFTVDTLVVTPPITTTYTITGTNSNGCVNKGVFTQTVLACTGIHQQSGETGFALFPNPTNDLVRVVVSADYLKENPLISVYNLVGQLLYESAVSEPETKINLAKFDNGLYIIRLSSPHGVINKTVVKN